MDATATGVRADRFMCARCGHLFRADQVVVHYETLADFSEGEHVYLCRKHKDVEDERRAKERLLGIA